MKLMLVFIFINFFLVLRFAPPPPPGMNPGSIPVSSSLDHAICPIASTKPYRLLLANPQNFPNSKTLSTL